MKQALRHIALRRGSQTEVDPQSCITTPGSTNDARRAANGSPITTKFYNLLTTDPRA
jgi:hypothetical protein